MVIRQPATPVRGGASFEHTADDLARALRGRRVAVLSGAGLSTESGIPDYRGEDRVGPVRTPITYQQFVGSAEARRRYWARSAVGWSAMRKAEPNAGHMAVAELEGLGVVNGVITQNVDGLHQAAGSVTVVELHGSLALVRCLRCGRTESRESLQGRIKLLNPEFMAAEVRVLPDGDADLDNSLIGGFVVPECLHCGGVLKTDVVFFGENVPAARVARSVALLDGADALLVLGSSLAVRSGYRFVVNAKEAGKLVAIVNHGPTRGDADADVRVEGRLGQVLPALARLLAAPPP